LCCFISFQSRSIEPRVVPALPSPARRAPLVEFNRRSACCKRWSSVLLVERSPYAVQRPSGIHVTAVRPTKAGFHPLVDLALLQSPTTEAARSVSGPSSSHRVLGPCSASGVSPPNAGVTYLLRSARELSQLLDGFLLTTPCGLISSRRHSWGSRLQGFSLLGSRTASLRPLPSGRWASETDRRLQGFAHPRNPWAPTGL
jgi:hypothetical protein